MTNRKHLMKATLAGMRLFGVLALMITTVGGVAASPTAQELAEGGLWTMAIGADTESVSAGVYDARFVVTTEDGDYIGECTIEDLGSTGTLQVCHVDVPSDRISLVWQDEAHLPAGFAPIENPIAFDPTVYETGPHNIGAYFHNVPIDGSTSQSQISDAANEPPALTYFALGDSYASGHGLDKEEGACKRSPYSYPFRVQDALSEVYQAVEIHHLACSGATGGANGKEEALRKEGKWDADKNLSHQLETVYAFLDERDDIANPDPVLVTITIGANDIGLDNIGTLRKVIRWMSITSATGFFEWLDVKTSPVGSTLSPAIDTLLSHENVYIVLTDYPNPFHKESLGGDGCIDFFRTLTCTDAMEYILAKLNGIMLDQFIRVSDPSILRVVGLGSSFASHSSVCGYPSGIGSTWFQNPKSASANDMLDACFHPNASGAQGIADAVVESVQRLGIGNDSSGLTEQTWSASVQVNMCDAPPNSGREMNCHGESGVVVDISLTSGELLGSCTTDDPIATPWGNTISLCSVDGMPFNADLVATQDPATIPSGYVPHVDTLTLQVGELIPGGGDEATFTFFNIQTGASSSSTTNEPEMYGAIGIPGFSLIPTDRNSSSAPKD